MTESFVWPASTTETALWETASVHLFNFIPEQGEYIGLGNHPICIKYHGPIRKLLVQVVVIISGSMGLSQCSQYRSNYHTGSTGQVSAGNCIQGHTRVKSGIQA